MVINAMDHLDEPWVITRSTVPSRKGFSALPKSFYYPPIETIIQEFANGYEAIAAFHRMVEEHRAQKAAQRVRHSSVTRR